MIRESDTATDFAKPPALAAQLRRQAKNHTSAHDALV